MLITYVYCSYLQDNNGPLGFLKEGVLQKQPIILPMGIEKVSLYFWYILNDNRVNYAN